MKTAVTICSLAMLVSCRQTVVENAEKTMGTNVEKTDAEWKAQLTPMQYRVLRKAGTERAGTGALLHNKQAGTYTCAGCGAELFASGEKYESGCGWPSFYQTSHASNIAERVDSSVGMRRTEVLCSNCGGHLGHVFEDGPQPTGQRYCINSASLGFKEEDRISRQAQRSELRARRRASGQGAHRE